MTDEDKIIGNDLNEEESSLKENNNQDQIQLLEENNKGHKVIHKKEGRLHIYVRQDKYKGELKSKNWVGRLYFNGKQKISSSGTQNLEEAIPILEKWFDKINTEQPAAQSKEDETQNDLSQNELIIDKKSEETKTKLSESITNDTVVQNKNADDTSEKKILKSSMFEKLKSIKFGKSKTKEQSSETKENKSQKKNINSIFKNLFKSKVSIMSVSGEEIAGLDITRDAIRVTQVTGDKEKGWLLDKFSYRSLDQEQIPENILDAKDYLANEIELALANAKITTKNIAMSIPVTSAIIRVVPCALMTEDELQKAIETDSLWENLVQLGENLNDYSVFHQVINRDTKQQTMEILFVASKLTDINAYSSLAKKSGLNPVIVDVRCFTLKNAYDNTVFKNVTEKDSSTILELGSAENYLMIIHNNNPIITDVFLREPEKEHLVSFSPTNSNTESQSVIRRYAMQVKQALNDYEGKYQNKINNIQVISSLKNINLIIPEFKKNLPNVGFHLFDPLEGVSVPSYNTEKVNLDNRSPLASVIGLAYRKLDVFGYYKFVTAVKNINLLPNRDAIRQKAKIKFLSGFAFKGLAGVIAAFYIGLIIFSYFSIQSNKGKLEEFNKVQVEYDNLNTQFKKIETKFYEMSTSLELGRLVSSNQSSSYRALAQIARSVPLRVEFSKLSFDGKNNVNIEGLAFNDQDILNFIHNLNSKSLIKQASLVDKKLITQTEGMSGSNRNAFVINCKLKEI